MKQSKLIHMCKVLIDQADGRCGAGHPAQAKARLIELRQLLNSKPVTEDLRK